MSFEVRQANTFQYRVGHYILIHGIYWIIEDVTIDIYGAINLHLYDERRFERRIEKVGTIEELVTRIPDATYERK